MTISAWSTAIRVPDPHRPAPQPGRRSRWVVVDNLDTIGASALPSASNSGLTTHGPGQCQGEMLLGDAVRSPPTRLLLGVVDKTGQPRSLSTKATIQITGARNAQPAEAHCPSPTADSPVTHQLLLTRRVPYPAIPGMRGRPVE